MTDSELTHIFTYHAPSPEQVERYQRLREAALAYARACMAEMPDHARDREAVVGHIRDANMRANQSIALARQVP